MKLFHAKMKVNTYTIREICSATKKKMEKLGFWQFYVRHCSSVFATLRVLLCIETPVDHAMYLKWHCRELCERFHNVRAGWACRRHPYIGSLPTLICTLVLDDINVSLWLATQDLQWIAGRLTVKRVHLPRMRVVSTCKQKGPAQRVSRHQSQWMYVQWVPLSLQLVPAALVPK